MKTRARLLIVLFVCLLVATPALAQDASQVLALSVSFGTLKNSTKMTDAMRDEVAQLETQARTASRERRYADAIRIYNHAMATLRGQAWTPSRAMSIAMRLRPARVILEQFVVHGDADPTVSVDESRRMVKAAKDLGIEIQYIEVPGGDHSNVVVPNFKPIFDWFDVHRRRPQR